MAKYYVEITKTVCCTVEAEDEDEAFAIAEDHLTECYPDEYYIEKVEEQG